MFRALRVEREDERRDLLHFTLRTSPSDVSFDSMSCSPHRQIPQASGSGSIENKNSRKSPRKSNSEFESNGPELLASISDALSSLKPPKNPDAEKAEVSLKIFAALKAAREFQTSCADLPDAKEASQKEIDRLLNNLRKLNEN
jgi:hypothetical protein